MKIIVNPNKEIVNEVRAALQKNEGYCPCRITHSPENKCMCKEFVEAPAKTWCHCQLYYKEEV